MYWYVWRDGDESVGSMTYELKDSSGTVVASGTLKLDSSVQTINIGGVPYYVKLYESDTAGLMVVLYDTPEAIHAIATIPSLVTGVPVSVTVGGTTYTLQGNWTGTPSVDPITEGQLIITHICSGLGSIQTFDLKTTFPNCIEDVLGTGVQILRISSGIVHYGGYTTADCTTPAAISFNANNGTTYQVTANCTVKIDWDEKYSNNIPTYLGDKYLFITVDVPPVGFTNTARIDISTPLPSENCITFYPLTEAPFSVQVCRKSTIIHIDTYPGVQCASDRIDNMDIQKGEVKSLNIIPGATISLQYNDNHRPNLPLCS